MSNETESVRIEKIAIEKTREVIEGTRQTLGGFITVATLKEADRILKLRAKKLSNNK